MEMPEGNFAVSMHGITITLNVAIIYFLLRTNKSWNQMKERCNQLYKKFCDEHHIDFDPIK